MLLAVRGLRKYFPVHQGMWRSEKGFVHALDGVSLSLPDNQTIGLVGESGCGKSTLARLMIGLIRPDAGEIFLKGREISTADPRQLKELRQSVQMMFQDSANAFDPRFTVEKILREPLEISRKENSVW